MIKAVLFDLDGTIINTNELIIKSFEHVLNEFLGLKVERNEIIKSFGEPLVKTMEYYGGTRAMEAVEEYLTFSKGIHNEYIRSYDHVEEGLKELKNNGLRLGIVTSKIREVALKGMDIFNLAPYFDVIICPEDTKKHKPDGEPVEKACRELGIKTSEALMIGDSHNDILCGKNAGAYTGVVNYTYLDRNEIMELKPDIDIDRIGDIIYKIGNLT